MKGSQPPVVNWPELPGVRKSPTPKPVRVAGAPTDTVNETLRLFQQGNNVGKIAERRGMEVMTIENHISKVLQRRPCPLQINDLVPLQRQNTILAVAPNEVDRLRAVKELLPPDFTYPEIKWTLAAHDRWKGG